MIAAYFCGGAAFVTMLEPVVRELVSKGVTHLYVVGDTPLSKSLRKVMTTLGLTYVTLCEVWCNGDSDESIMSRLEGLQHVVRCSTSKIEVEIVC